MSIMIGVPAFNESKTIAKIVSGATSFGTVVVVDDGSTDNTYRLAKEAGAIIISHSKNLGYGTSIKDLFRMAKHNNYDVLITLDGDNQHNPSEIPNFIEAIKTSDIIIGNRFLGNHNTPTYRKLGIKTISKLNGLTDSQCGFRTYNKKAIQTIAGNIFESGMGVSIEILQCAKFNNLTITEIPCTIYYNHEKHSQNPLSHGIDLILAFIWWGIWTKPAKSLLPLGLAFLLGATITGTQAINLYTKFHVVVYSWSFLSAIFLLCALMTFNTLIFVLCFKNRKVNE